MARQPGGDETLVPTFPPIVQITEQKERGFFVRVIRPRPKRGPAVETCTNYSVEDVVDLIAELADPIVVFPRNRRCPPGLTHVLESHVRRLAGRCATCGGAGTVYGARCPDCAAPKR